MSPQPTASIDERFSDPAADATPWSEAERALTQAELYWITTVRRDGRPHVTPLVGVADGGIVHFTTGLEEQKARNLEHNDQVAMTTGSNTWDRGLDVVVEGRAVRVTDQGSLHQIAEAYLAKYGSAWEFEVGDGVFRHGGEHDAAVFRIEPDKVIAFAKEPHAQTTYRPGR
jgi:pyridoxine/pyridoxamine 5'-phosphate oxidase